MLHQNPHFAQKEKETQPTVSFPSHFLTDAALNKATTEKQPEPITFTLLAEEEEEEKTKVIARAKEEVSASKVLLLVLWYPLILF